MVAIEHLLRGVELSASSALPMLVDLRVDTKQVVGELHVYYVLDAASRTYRPKPLHHCCLRLGVKGGLWLGTYLP